MCQLTLKSTYVSWSLAAFFVKLSLGITRRAHVMPRPLSQVGVNSQKWMNKIWRKYILFKRIQEMNQNDIWAIYIWLCDSL